MSPTTALPRRSAALRAACVTALLAVLVAAPAWSVHAGSGREPGAPGAWPLSPTPTVARAFDPPDLRWSAGHRGVDLAGTLGQVVRAALPGTVSFVGTIAGRGVVVVDHGHVRTTYEPVAGGVDTGDAVAAGQPIGTLTAAGSHCFPAACLHWGLVRNSDDAYLDPLSLLGARPVRLHPWAGAAASTPGTNAPRATTPGDGTPRTTTPGTERPKPAPRPAAPDGAVRGRGPAAPGQFVATTTASGLLPGLPSRLW